jgi:uncharacterized damage-inducible protein DinB
MKTLRIMLAAGLLATGLAVSFAFKASDESPSAFTEKQASMVADWERAKLYTLDYINAANDQTLTLKPTPEMRSFSQQLLHLSEANFGLAAAASGKTPPYQWGALEKSDQYNSKAALSKIVGESYDYVITAIKESNEQKFAEKIKLFGFDLTKEATFNKVFEHQTHHRGQSTVYLRLSGVKPPDERLF